MDIVYITGQFFTWYLISNVNSWKFFAAYVLEDLWVNGGWNDFFVGEVLKFWKWTLRFREIFVVLFLWEILIKNTTIFFFHKMIFFILATLLEKNFNIFCTQKKSRKKSKYFPNEFWGYGFKNVEGG